MTTEPPAGAFEDVEAMRSVTSFDDFVRTRGTGLVRFAAVLTADPGLGEDIVQNVLIRAHADWTRIAGMDATEAYLRRAIVNEYLSWRRKWSRFVPHARLPDDGDPRSMADHVVTRSELAGRIARLPPRQRSALVLRYFEGLADPEIAATLGCRAVTVRGYISRALHTLRIDMTADAAAAEGTDNAHRD